MKISTALSTIYDIELARSITLAGRVNLREAMGEHNTEHHMCEKLWSEVYITSKSMHRVMINRKDPPPPFDVIKREMEKVEPWTLMVQLRGHWFQCDQLPEGRSLTRLDLTGDDTTPPVKIWVAKFSEAELFDVEGDRTQLEKDLVIHKVFLK